MIARAASYSRKVSLRVRARPSYSINVSGAPKCLDEPRHQRSESTRNRIPVSANGRPCIWSDWIGTGPLLRESGTKCVLHPVLAGTVRMIVAAVLGWSAVIWYGASVGVLFQIVAVAALVNRVLTAAAFLPRRMFRAREIRAEPSVSNRPRLLFDQSS